MHKAATLCLALLTAAALTPSQTAHRTVAKKTPAGTAPVSPGAAWTSMWQQFGGLSEEQFHKFGYDRLSEDEGKAIFAWILANRASMFCGKVYGPAEKEDLKYVHPFVQTSDDNSTSFVGELRSKLGGTQDVKLAYADSDADLVIQVLAMPLKETTGRESGFVASVTVMAPCKYSVPSGFDQGTSTFNKVTNSYLQVGPDEASVLSRIASSLDVNDFDPIRTQHSQIIKLY